LGTDLDDLRIIAMPGTENFCSRIDYYLKTWRNTNNTFILPATLTRFVTGDGKAVLEESVRAKDIYIVSDPYNYSVTYKMRGIVNHMSPDDHFQDIKRIISAINGKTQKISVLMNSLYAARQHRRNMRESLDCAMGLRELENLGVKNFITFDAHDPRVENAVPLMSLDNLYPNYQMLKSLVRNVENIKLDSESTIVIAPDAGSVQRCIKYAESLNLDIGMFYKQRNTAHIVDGNNPIERHEFIGHDLFGKDVIIIDDILATGTSMIDSFYQLKGLGAKRVFAFVTFGLFTAGYDALDKAYGEKVFDKIFISNLTYHNAEGEEKPYIIKVDLSKYAAYIVDCIHKGISISKVLDPNHKIRELVKTLQ
jgi:ribose-phosphate pyrophosphokinase